MKAERRNKRILIFRLAVLVVPTVVLLMYEYFRMGKIGNLTADGRLYLSVADNFLANGHFIQYVFSEDPVCCLPSQNASSLAEPG